MNPRASALQNRQLIRGCTNQISAVVQALHSSKLKKDFMTAFVEDPVGFLNKWVSSQSKDLQVVLGDGGVNPEEARRSEFYRQDRIKEALYHYMSEREMH